MASWILKEVKDKEVGPPISLSQCNNVIGRKIGSFIHYNSLHASRRHCTIRIKNNGCYLIDHKTLNGTYIGVDKIPSEREIPLVDGDKIGIGVAAHDLSPEPYFIIHKLDFDPNDVTEIPDTCTLDATQVYPKQELDTKWDLVNCVNNALKLDKGGFKIPPAPKDRADKSSYDIDVKPDFLATKPCKINEEIFVTKPDTSRLNEYSVCDDIIIIDSDQDEDDVPCSQLFNTSRRDKQDDAVNTHETLNSFRELELEDDEVVPNIENAEISDPKNYDKTGSYELEAQRISEIIENEFENTSSTSSVQELPVHSQLSPEIYMERVHNENSVVCLPGESDKEEVDLLAALMTQKEFQDLELMNLNIFNGNEPEEWEENYLDGSFSKSDGFSPTKGSDEKGKKRKVSNTKKDIKRKHETGRSVEEPVVKNPRCSLSPLQDLKSKTVSNLTGTKELVVVVSPLKEMKDAGKKLQATISFNKRHSPKVVKDPYTFRESEKRKIRDVRKKKLQEVALKEKERKSTDSSASVLPKKVSESSLNKKRLEKDTDNNRAILIDMLPQKNKNNSKKGCAKAENNHEKQTVNKRTTNSKDLLKKSSHQNKKENTDSNVSKPNLPKKGPEKLGGFSKIFRRTSLRNIEREREVLSKTSSRRRSSILKKRGSNGPRKIVQFAEGENLTLIKYIENDIVEKEKQFSNNRHVVSSSTRQPFVNGTPKTSDDILYLICKWNPSWIEESVRIEALPPLLEGFPGQCAVGMCYENYTQYQNALLPLQVYELWQTILRDSHQNKQQPFEGIVRDAYEKPDKKMEVINVTTYVSNLGHMIKKGDFVIVKGIDKNCNEKGQGKMHQVSSKSNMWLSFGYVENQPTKKPLQHSDQTSISAYRTLSSKSGERGSGQIFTVNLQVMVRPKRNKFWKNGLHITLLTCSNLTLDLKLFQTLQKMVYSPLAPLILNPVANLPPATISSNPSDYPFKQQEKLNNEQMCAVGYCAEMVLSSKPAIALIHGPPGTGKSITITHIIMTVLDHVKKDKQRTRILLCAPSNFAVDQVVSKLLNIRSKLGKNKFNMVRVGTYDMMSEEAKLISLTDLAEKSLKSFSNPVTAKAEIALLEKREKYLMSLTSGSSIEKQQSIATDINDIRKYSRELRLLSEGKADQNIKTNLLKHYERELLLKADIVATTLSSSYSLPIKQHLVSRERKPFDCCIIDEASQATELLSLVPILLGVDKFILVGDHKQLSPVVLSQKSKTDGLEVSLFERLHSCWNVSNDKVSEKHTPVFALKKQFRMHREIASFPNSIFYSGFLETVDKPSISSLRPYMVFSHNFQQSQNQDKNPDESCLVLRLVEAVRHINGCENMSVGIITPYNSQRELIYNSLPQNLRKSISVMTIDSAQGQERDVIILSCVKTQSIGFLADPYRLNVALTRAKYALYITANFKSLKGNQIWKNLIFDAKDRKLVQELRLVPSESVIKRHISHQTLRPSL